jgi:hypothetical protein
MSAIERPAVEEPHLRRATPGLSADPSNAQQHELKNQNGAKVYAGAATGGETEFRVAGMGEAL